MSEPTKARAIPRRRFGRPQEVEYRPRVSLEQAQAQYEQTEDGKRAMAARREDWLTRADLPVQAVELFSDGWRETDAWQRVSAAYEAARASRKRWILVAGGLGTGKTTAVCRLLWLHSRGLFIRSAAYSSGAFKEHLEAAWRASWLAIDDMGVKKERGEVITDLWEERYNRQLTLATTNLLKKTDNPVALMRQLYGVRNADRFREVGTMVWCPRRERPEGR
jgi:hypothetical protein